MRVLRHVKNAVLQGVPKAHMYCDRHDPHELHTWRKGILVGMCMRTCACACDQNYVKVPDTTINVCYAIIKNDHKMC